MLVVASAARAQSPDPGVISEMPLPGGLRAALAVVDDRVAPDHSLFLLEFIRRSYDAPHGPKGDDRTASLQSLLARLDATATGAPSTETLPLPLTPGIWIDAVFGGRATPETLLASILRNRNASLLYYGLLSLDDATRAWLATDSRLIADLALRQSAAFAVAAPGLRVANGVVRVPGGATAEPVWHALVGRSSRDPDDFVRALVSGGEGRLAYFFAAMSELSDAQLRLALNLDDADDSNRIDAARRVYATFERVAPGWKIEDRAFRRPALDAALLLADLRVDGRGRPSLPGTRRFWNAVFDEPRPGRAAKSIRAEDAAALAGGDPVDFAWLCDQIFRTDEVQQRRRYQLVLFASRAVRQLTRANAVDAVDAVRAAAAYPALVAVLERAKVTDLAVVAAAARRAAQIAAIADDTRAIRALSQFQGTLAVVTRAASRANLPPETIAELVSSLSAVDLGVEGDYEGRMVRWVDGWVSSPVRDRSKTAASGPSVAEPHQTGAEAEGGERQNAGWNEAYDDASPLDLGLFRMLAGASPFDTRVVDWEGMRYRVDLPRAEATRLTRLLGDRPPPYLSSARTLTAIADAVSESKPAREPLRGQTEALDRVAEAVGWRDPDARATLVWDDTGVPGRYRDASTSLSRLERADRRADLHLAAALRLLADDLLARGLLDLVYAVALGQADRASIAASDVATRHDFGLRPTGISAGDPWQLPVPTAGTTRGWRVTGALLGLDVKLADMLLVRISAKPPARKPTLNDGDRRVLTEAIALVQSAALTTSDRDDIVAAIRRGRQRLAGLKTPGDAAALADEIRLSPARRTLLPWSVVHEPGRVPSALSPTELMWVGLDRKPVAPSLSAWGAPGEPRLGCLCLQLLDRRAWETLAGRRNSGMLATGFPDLNLRLAELLADLQMPPQLLGAVLGAATLDFINTMTSRDPDDWRGLVDFVQSLRAERIEQYLALLTTDGPLVPVGTAPQHSSSTPGAAR